MNWLQLRRRILNRYRLTLSRRSSRRLISLSSKQPMISFTFDDFPRSSLRTGGAILQDNGVLGTYYASLGLMNTEAPTGLIFSEDDLAELLSQGHELGCHTFDHFHSWDTDPSVFEKSLIENRRALARMAPGTIFESFSYPITIPRPGTKKRVANHFSCSREGGQTFNVGDTDLNSLRAFFLEKSRDGLASVQKIIEENNKASGWLIFATHDICEDPTPYGCKPAFFEAVVKQAVASGAKILPVRESLKRCSKP